VVITGILAWQWELEGQKLKGILLMHLVMGCVSSVLIWVVWFIHRRVQRQNGGILPGYRLPIEALAVVIVALTGHLGGFLSGVNGPG
jgi:heme/copper-type cytochrome/quinol oxidase subunit 2